MAVQPSDNSAVGATVAELAEQDAIQNVTTEVPVVDPFSLLIAPEVSSTTAATLATYASAVAAVDVSASAVDDGARVEPAHLEEAYPATADDDVTNTDAAGQTVTDSTVREGANAMSTVEVEVPAVVSDATLPALTEPSCDVTESVTPAVVSPPVDVQVVVEDQDEAKDPFGELVAAPVTSPGVDAEVGVNTAGESVPTSIPSSAFSSAPAATTAVPSEQSLIDNTGDIFKTRGVGECTVAEEVENVSAVTSAPVADGEMKAETQAHGEEETSAKETEKIDTFTTTANTPAADEVDIAAVSQVPVSKQEPVSTKVFPEGKVETEGEMEPEVPVAPVVAVEEEEEKEGEENGEEKREEKRDEEVDPFGELSFQQAPDPIPISPVISIAEADADPFADISFLSAPVLESNEPVDPLYEQAVEQAVEKEDEEDEWDDFEGPTPAATSPIPDTITAATTVTVVDNDAAATTAAVAGEVAVLTRPDEVPAVNTGDVATVSNKVVEEEFFDDFAASASAPAPASVVNSIDQTPSADPSAPSADVDVTAALNDGVTSSELNLASSSSNNNEMEEDEEEWDAFEGLVATTVTPTTAPIAPMDNTVVTDAAVTTSAHVDSAPFSATATADSGAASDAAGANGIVDSSGDGPAGSDFTFAAFESNTEPVIAGGNSFEASFDANTGMHMLCIAFFVGYSKVIKCMKHCR